MLSQSLLFFFFLSGFWSPYSRNSQIYSFSVHALPQQLGFDAAIIFLDYKKQVMSFHSIWFSHYNNRHQNFQLSFWKQRWNTHDSFQKCTNKWNDPIFCQISAHQETNSIWCLSFFIRWRKKPTVLPSTLSLVEIVQLNIIIFDNSTASTELTHLM